MKLTNKQKLSIQKSLKLNEDFFDDFDSNELIDEPVDDSFGEPDYMYHIHFIIYINQFIKCIIPKSPFMNRLNDEYLYYFEEPKYKSVIESAFLSMKKTLDYIFQAMPIVTDYSEPKFCSSLEKIIKTFPFITKNQSNEFEIESNDNQFIILKTSINLSKRKNEHNITKLFYSFWRLQQIYNKLLRTKKFNITKRATSYINIGVYKDNPHKKTILYELSPSDTALTPTGLELINFLNSKDETDE